MTDHSVEQQLAAQFYDLNRYLSEGGDRDGATKRLVDLAVRAVPGCSWAGVTTYSPKNGAQGIASSDGLSSEIDDIQHDLDEGPCVTAAVVDDLASVRIDDLAADDRWPEFCKVVTERTPVRSIMSFHLTGGDTGAPRSALNLYGAEPRVFTSPAIDIGVLFATHARALMLHSRSAELVNHLNEALTSSRQIGTAIGVLMAMHKVTADEAFEMLSTASQHLNRKLRLVADHVTQTGTLPERR